MLIFSFLWSFSTQPYNIALTNNISYKPLNEIDISRSNVVSPVQFVFDGKYFYVIDSFTQTLYKFDQEGDLITKIDRLKGQAFQPAGLALDYDYLYLLDKNGILHKFNKSLDLQEVYDLDIRDKEKYFSDPRGLTIDDNKDLYTVDSGMNTFIKINMLGIVEWQRGLFGSSPESLNEPLDIAVDAHFNIYVLDSGNHRVKVYDQTEFLYAVNQLNDPRGISVRGGADNSFFVADYGRKAVDVFKNRELVGFITNYKDRDIFPQDVFCLDKTLYVLDSAQKKIFLYDLE